MQVGYPRSCGVDVHKKAVTACIMLTAEDGTVPKETRTFSTMTHDLFALDAWLDLHQIDQVAFERTGISWRPVYNVLEDDQRTVILVNAQHMKAVPGRKTDVKDAEWLADLLRHGLLTASFIPPAPIRALRDLTRYRKALVQQRTQEVNRLHKVLETANVKLSSVASDITGVSGRRMLEAIERGEDDPVVLAELAKGRLQEKLPLLRQALEGRVQAYHRVLIREVLDHIESVESAISRLDREIGEQMDAHATAEQLLLSLPAAGQTSAAAIVAEIGTDMRRFVSAHHLASWAGLCPGNRVSAGKRQSGRTRKGNKHLRTILCELAQIITRSPGSHVHALYQRIARRRSKGRAIIAVAHSLLVSIYYMLREGVPYQELGADYVERHDAQRLERHYVHRLEALGVQVQITRHWLRKPCPNTLWRLTYAIGKSPWLKGVCCPGALRRRFSDEARLRD